VCFFDRDNKTGQERELKHTSAAFRKAVDKLSFHIEKLFDAMLRGTEKVFVARTAVDATEEREAIIREIRAAGYALSPPPDGAIPKGLDRKTLCQFMDETRVTVHLLGAAFESGIREQIDLAIEAEKKVVFCLTRGHESATGEQRKLIDEIRENKWNLPKEKRELLESRSPVSLRRDLVSLLAPPRPTCAAAQDCAARVYLLYDPSTEDAGFVCRVQDAIRDREQMAVEVPQAPTDAFSPAAEHERRLRECNGLLLYYEKSASKMALAELRGSAECRGPGGPARVEIESDAGGRGAHRVPGTDGHSTNRSVRGGATRAIPGSAAWGEEWLLKQRAQRSLV
jgi:hypothetical protein